MTGVTMKDAAAILGCSRTTLNRYLDKRELRIVGRSPEGKLLDADLVGKLRAKREAEAADRARVKESHKAREASPTDDIIRTIVVAAYEAGTLGEASPWHPSTGLDPRVDQEWTAGCGRAGDVLVSFIDEDEDTDDRDAELAELEELMVG